MNSCRTTPADGAQLSLPLPVCWSCEKPGQLTPDPRGLICGECSGLIAAETPEDKDIPA